MKPTNSIWATNIGTPLKNFIKMKFGSQKKCSRLLNIPESSLSMIITGKRKISYADQRKFIAYGFEKEIFYQYINVFPEDDYTSVNDLRFVIGQLKDIIDTKELLLNAAKMLNANLQAELSEAKSKITRLKKQVYENSVN